MPAIILGKSATALYAIRELGREGVNVFVENSSDNFTKHSKYAQAVKSSITINSDNDRVEYLLNDFPVSEQNKGVLIACSDQDIDFIYNNVEKLSTKYLIQNSIQDGSATTIMDKEGLLKLCIENDIAIPACWTKNKAQLNSLIKDIEFPCIIKPTLIHEVKTLMAGRKLWVAKNSTEYENIIDNLPEGNTEWIIQEMIPGPESEIWLYSAFFDSESNPHHAFTARKLRQYPPGFGSASLVCSAENNELKDISEKFFNNIGFKGIGAAEFKRDPRDGKLKMIEINPRPSLWFGVSTAANKYITTCAYKDAKGQPLPTDQVQLNGVFWRYWLKDLFSIAFYSLNKKFILPSPNFKGAPKKVKAATPVFVINDIKPSLVELLQLTKKAISRLSKGNR